jgi:hypothetical protein
MMWSELYNQNNQPVMKISRTLSKLSYGMSFVYIWKTLIPYYLKLNTVDAQCKKAGT